jgi:lipid-A-disaccharide synthase-like uncharacterized protein
MRAHRLVMMFVMAVMMVVPVVAWLTCVLGVLILRSFFLSRQMEVGQNAALH